jgi:cellulose synthase/poly-beta-1,6-N-acetylglucosamine synthase-like glycosyltransferase
LPSSLQTLLHAHSPRFAAPPTPLASLLIHCGVALLWGLLFASTFVFTGVFAWSVGLVYIAYDTVLLVFTAVQTWTLRRLQQVPEPGLPVRLGVIVAAYNEAAVLPITLDALFSQEDTPELIIVADDGSSDGTAALLAKHFRLVPPPLGALSAPSPCHPSLRWLRLPHGGKAAALNVAIESIDAEIVLTVDADTLLEPGAIRAVRAAFAADARLVATTGVLTPVCDTTTCGRLFEWFQRYEYIRNFLSRFAWAQLDSLLLISGAFAGLRRDAVLEVGGFDPDCLVEDYELIHRLRRHSARNGLGWQTAVVGGARARTTAPATLSAFLAQRRRWFGGFLQTQYWYRDMVGDGRYGALGRWMLPVKAFDTLQPVFGLTAFALLVFYLVTGRVHVLLPVALVIGAKIVLDLAFHLWSIVLFRRWVGGPPMGVTAAVLASLLEPFSFQLLRHSGAALGWVTFLTGRQTWSAQSRGGLIKA